MKVDRVILATNNNPLYYDFWNNLSFTYKEKFGITPTLIFFGTEEELSEINLSKEYGDIIVQAPVPDIKPWQYTWGLFYFTKFFEDEVCAIMGIDQIPMGTYFLGDVIQNVPDENYVMLIDDQYKLEGKSKFTWNENGFSPSAYHIAKGSTFWDVYDFEETFSFLHIIFFPSPILFLLLKIHQHHIQHLLIQHSYPFLFYLMDY